MNEFFDDDRFMLVKVKFTESDGKRYTYAGLKKLKLNKGDLVVVPVGVAGTTGLNIASAYSVATVTSTTDNLAHIPNDFKLKPVIQKVNMNLYRSILRSQTKHVKK